MTVVEPKPGGVVSVEAKPAVELDPRHPRVRLTAFFDPGSYTAITAEDDSGMLAATGRCDGVPVVAFCSDPTVQGGAMGTAGCKVILAAYARALADRTPVVGLWHSGGARLRDVGFGRRHGRGHGRIRSDRHRGAHRTSSCRRGAGTYW